MTLPRMFEPPDRQAEFPIEHSDVAPHHLGIVIAIDLHEHAPPGSFALKGRIAPGDFPAKRSHGNLKLDRPLYRSRISANMMSRPGLELPERLYEGVVVYGMLEEHLAILRWCLKGTDQCRMLKVRIGCHRLGAEIDVRIGLII